MSMGGASITPYRKIAHLGMAQAAGQVQQFGKQDHFASIACREGLKNFVYGPLSPIIGFFARRRPYTATAMA
ncbi:protein of unknown function [Pseudomonas mediterranea]